MKKLFSTVLAAVIFCAAFCLSSCKNKTEVGCRYEITAEYRADAQTLAGTVKVDFCNQTADTLSQLKFHLYPNAYRKNALYPPVTEGCFNAAYYGGADYGGVTVTSVNGAKNWSIEGEDENILLVKLYRELAPSEKVTLDISFVTELANVNHRLGVTAHTVNLGNAFPSLCAYKNGEFTEEVYSAIGDPFDGDYADYRVNLTLPSEYVVAASAAAEITKGLESKTKYSFELDCARDFSFVFSKEFDCLQADVDGMTVNYYYYDDKEAAAHLSLATAAVKYFNAMFGKYPYQSFSLAQTGFCYGGMEYPALVMLSDSLGEEEYRRSIVHETAHQWWYAAVGSDQINEAWQDESLAEYSAVLFFENHSDYGFTREELIRECLQEYRSYFSVYGSVFGQIDTKMSRRLSEYSSEYEYRCLAYDKGVIMWDTLKKSIGEKKFFQGLKNYYKSNQFKNATPADLIAAFEKTGVSVDGFFHSFLSGKAVI